MPAFESDAYEDTKIWIHKRLKDAKFTAEQVRMGLQGSAQDLEIFLARRQIEDAWPRMTPEEWAELVDECVRVREKLESLEILGSDGRLIDGTQDNDSVKFPQGGESCWQLYLNRLREKGWKEESLDALGAATMGILRRFGRDTVQTVPVKGMVIGYVQSGKTANMEAVMSLAADNGWNLFIVLSGTIESLRLQTLNRITDDLNQGGNLEWVCIDHPSKKSPMGQRAQDLNWRQNSRMRYYTVCLKNVGRLGNLNDWIHADAHAHEQMKILIIDDEADQASISNTAVVTGQEEKERKGVNQRIVSLVNDVPFRKPAKGKTTTHARSVTYVMYTATPYANVLNEATKDSLYPASFIWALKAPKEYIGPKEIFGSRDLGTDGLNMKRVVPPEELFTLKAVYDGTTDRIPPAMEDAIRWFLCSVAVMRHWGYRKSISMLIHTSQKQLHHDAVAEAVGVWLEDACEHPRETLESCREIYQRETEALSKELWLSQFPDYGVETKNIRDYPDFGDIEQEILTLLSVPASHIRMSEDDTLTYTKGIHLVIDNCSKNGINREGEHVRLAYPDPKSDSYPSPAPAFLVIGGSTLSRGLTLEGLVCTFFLRGSCQADTLMQMGRWFGYRKGYELLPRIWMTRDTIEKFRFLADLEMDLREDIKKYMAAGVSPTEYGPRVLCSPRVSWLRATSARHSRNAQPADMDFSGARPQTIAFDRDEGKQRENIRITERFLEGLGEPQVSWDKTSLYWGNVELNVILDRFLLGGFHFSEHSQTFNEIGAFCAWIRELRGEIELQNWSVVVSGTGKVDSVQDPDQRHWRVAGHILEKVNRSRKISASDEQTINIGVLRVRKDLLEDLDLPEDTVVPAKQSEVDEMRLECGMGAVPMLILYRIDGQSKKGSSSKDRENLDLTYDIIGVQICIPGERTKKTFVKHLTVRLPERDLEDSVDED